MSANAEDSDSSVRVTRRSMRRMASTESLIDAVDTPTVAPRNKKLNTISELAGTPKTSQTASPRRTRKTSEEPPAVGSPFRRTTRASSQDIEVAASPLPTRASRRSALAESDTDDAASTPAKVTKADRNKRKSIIASAKIEQIAEEPEDDNEKEEGDEKSKDLDSSNDLELRNRSITKSPSAKSPSASPPKSSLNGSLNASKKTNGDLNSSPEEAPEPMKVFKSRNERESKTSITEISFHDSDNEELPAKSFSKVAHQSMIVHKTTFEGCLERISNSVGKKKPLSESFAEELDAGAQKDEKIASVNKTPVRGRRSIHDSESTSDETPIMKAKLEDLVKMRESFIAKDSPKSAKKSPAAEETPVKTAEGTPAKTPKSEKKAEKSAKTPQSAKKTPESEKNTPKLVIDETGEVEKLMEDFVDEAEALATPKSAKKLPNGTTAVEILKSGGSKKKLANGTPARVKTPKSAKKAVETPGKSPKNFSESVCENQNMDISDNGQIDATIAESVLMETENGDDGDARDMEVTLNKSGASQKVETPKNEKKYSIFGYVKNILSSSKRLSVKSLPDNASDKESEDEKVVEPRRKSWAVSVTRPANEAIDTAAKAASPVVIKGKDQRVKGYSSDEDDGEEEQPKNEFVDDEAEVGDEESITESEANYIRDHEVPDDGESIGSEDTDPEDYVDDEEEGSSFLASEDEDIDQYSMDSAEEELEELDEKPMRKSRIIAPSSSEDEEVEVEKTQAKAAKSSGKAEKSPGKSPKSASKKVASEVEDKNELEEGEDLKEEGEKQEAEEEDQTSATPAKPSRKSTQAVAENAEIEQVEEPKSKKMKRRRESDLNGSVNVQPKRAKLSDTSIVENPANTTGIAELFEEATEEKPVKQKKAKKPTEPEAVTLEKVKNKVDEYMSGYTAEKKAKMALKREKKAQKLAQKQKEKEAEEAAKAADGLDSSNNSNKENALAPRKKNRNKVKKQKLVAEMPEEKESLAESVSKAQERLERKRQKKLEKKLAKQQKQQSAESETAKEVEEAPVMTKKAKVAPEPIVEKKKAKKNKNVEASEEPPAVEAEISKKKKKKEVVAEVEDLAAAPEKKKKKKVVEEEPEPEPAKKSKKRKLDESMEDAVVQPKKKLNVLKQIENPFQNQPQARASRNDDQDQLSIPLMSQKLKKVIPQKVEIEKKRKKKTNGGKKSIPEPRRSLPRPVFTTAGTFVEAPISPPFKFQSTKYVPIAKTASLPTSYGVVAFEAKKKKQTQQTQPAADFKTQAMFRNSKIRDGSSKNMAGLVRKQYSL